jgi:hypothetical protein
VTQVASPAREGGTPHSKAHTPGDPSLAFGEGNSHAKSASHMEPTERRCTGCSAWLPLENFPANRRMHLGVSSRCRECHREATRDWRRRNRDHVNADRRAAYRAEYPLVERPCVRCGQSFAGRPDALVCGAECRRLRKLERRRELRREKRSGGCSRGAPPETAR